MILRKIHQMNERIDQLWGQALDLAVPETYTQLSHSQVLKVKQVFAELIVRECVGILMKPEYAMNHPGELADYNRGWVNGRLLGIEHIEGYFGVEE
jgi:hypothetical protein